MQNIEKSCKTKQSLETMVLMKNIEAINLGFIAKLRQENVKTEKIKQAEACASVQKIGF